MAKQGCLFRGATGRADIRFGGFEILGGSNVSLKLLAGPAGQIPPDTNGISIKTDGSVKIGDFASNTGKLTVGNNNMNGIGVFAESPNGYGVFGASDSGYGIYGRSDSGYAGSFSGKLRVSGTGAFNAGAPARIDIINTLGAGFLQHVTDQGLWQLATTNGLTRIVVDNSGQVGIGTTTPNQKLEVNGRARITSIPLGAPVAQMCFNAAGDLLNCSTSSLRFKTNVHNYSDGLNILRKLSPISYNWKEGGAYDIGLGAEDVAKAAPFFAFRNKEGVVEGVRYERLNMVLINAVKEQQTQIEIQQKQIERQNATKKKQESEIDALRTLVCRSHRRAAVCRTQN